MNNESRRLDSVSEWYSTKKGFDGCLTHYVYQRIKAWFRGNSVLELGCADGGMSVHLPKHFEDITIVDGGEVYIDKVQALLGKQAIYHVGLFEKVKINRSFDTILATSILEHVEDPICVLNRIFNWLNPGGILIVAVPNALSLHRQVGVKMGILNHVQELSRRDRELKHRRVYTAKKLRTDIEAAGLCVIEMRGVFLKPLSNKQIETQWSQELIDGYYAMADEYPDLATPLIAAAEHL